MAGIGLVRAPRLLTITAFYSFSSLSFFFILNTYYYIKLYDCISVSAPCLSPSTYVPWNVSPMTAALDPPMYLTHMENTVFAD